MNKEYLNNLLQSTIGVTIGGIWTHISNKAAEICSHSDTIESSVLTAFIVNTNTIKFRLYKRHYDGTTTRTQFEESVLMDMIYDRELLEALEEYREVIIKNNIHK